MSYIDNGSFKFGTVDMYDTFGIMIVDTSVPEDYMIPAIRTRKITVPNRSGKYDYGAKYYDERPLTLNCVTTNKETGSTFRAYIREIAYVLSKKNEIRLWNEPDKYYIGRVEKEITLTQLRDIGNVFTLEFTCEPYAYGVTRTKPFVNRVLDPEYAGTDVTPTYIEIVNIGNADAVNIRISQIDRKDTY